MLGERNQVQGKLVAQNTGKSVLSSSTSTSSSGMRIPAGWGASIVDTSAQAQHVQSASSVVGATYAQGAIVRPQMTGFRPRPSTAGR